VLTQKILDRWDQKILTLWPINKEYSCLTALSTYYKVWKGERPIIVILNGYFGPQVDFDRWLDSDIRRSILAEKWPVYYITNLSGRANDYVSNNRLLISEALDSPSMPFGLKSSFERWLKVNEDTFRQIINWLPSSTDKKNQGKLEK